MVCYGIFWSGQFLVCNHVTRRPCWGSKQKKLFWKNLHENRVLFPEERNAFVLDHQHGRRDVTCKPAIETFWTRTTTSAIFNLKFFRVFSKSRHPGKLYCTCSFFLFSFFSLEKITLLSILKGVNRTFGRKMIKRLTFDYSFPPLRHFR